MGPTDIRMRARRALLKLAPVALVAGIARSQIRPVEPEHEPDTDNARLPNGKRQQDEILKEDYAKNLQEARDLVELARSFELDLEKDDRFVLSVASLKKLDDIEKLTKRLRGRLKRF